jgi:hypothetical protein
MKERRRKKFKDSPGGKQAEDQEIKINAKTRSSGSLGRSGKETEV